MTFERFQELLDAFGGEPSSWPEAERAAARRLLAGDSRARAALEKARLLDSLIRRGLAAGAASERAASEAADRVLARLSASALPPQLRRAPWTRAIGALAEWTAVEAGPRRLWPGLSALACAGALGVAIGVFAPDWIAPPAPERYAVSAEGDPGGLVFDGEQDAGAVL